MNATLTQYITTQGLMYPLILPITLWVVGRTQMQGYTYNTTQLSQEVDSELRIPIANYFPKDNKKK